MKNLKGFIAAVIAMATVASSASVMAFADPADPAESEATTTTAATTAATNKGSAEGSGDVEGIVNKEVFSVSLPTVPEGTFNFILDPQGLIAAAGNDAKDEYKNKSFEEGKHLFFANTAADADNDYSSESDKLIAYNLSSADVTLTVKGTVTNATGIEFTNTTFAADKAQVKLEIKADGTPADTDKAVFETANGATTASISRTIAKVADTNFEVKYADGEYSYALKDSIKDESGKYTSAVSKVEFNLAGDASTADTAWAGIKDVQPKVELTWEINSPFAPAEAAPSADASVTANATALVMPFDLGTGSLAATGVAKVEYKTPTSTSWSASPTTVYTVADNQIKWNASCSKTLKAGSTVRITFNDEAKTTAIVTVAAE